MHPPIIIIVSVVSSFTSPLHCEDDHESYDGSEEEEERDSDTETQDQVHVVLRRDGPEMKIFKFACVPVKISLPLEDFYAEQSLHKPTTISPWFCPFIEQNK